MPVALWCDNVLFHLYLTKIPLRLRIYCQSAAAATMFVLHDQQVQFVYKTYI